MNIKPFTTVRREFADTINAVRADREPLYITRNGEAEAVLISVEEFNALLETAYLLSSPVNARRLLDAVDELESGGGTVRELLA